MCSDAKRVRLQQQLGVVQHVLKMSTLCGSLMKQEVSRLTLMTH